MYLSIPHRLVGWATVLQAFNYVVSAGLCFLEHAASVDTVAEASMFLVHGANIDLIRWSALDRNAFSCPEPWSRI
jgi:hypothetical protein